MSFFKSSFMSFHLDLDPDCLLAISLVLDAFREETLYSSLLCDYIIVPKNNSIIIDQISIYVIRKLPWILMYILASIVKVMISIFPVHLNYMQPRITNDFTCFLQAVMFKRFLRTALDKISIIIALTIADSLFINDCHFHSIVLTL